MFTPEPFATFRYVADGELARRITRERWARLRHPRVWVTFMVCGLTLGVVWSLATNAASLPEYLGRVLLIGLLWGVGWLAVVALLTTVLVVPLVRLRERQIEAQYPAGSVTEIAMGVDGLVLVRPSGAATVIPYGAIRLVQTFGSLQTIKTRGRLWPEILPTGALPEPVIEYLTVRGQGARPVADSGLSGGITRQFVVPPGWARHVSHVYAGWALQRRAFLLRFGLASVGILVVAAFVGVVWAVAVPILGAAVFVAVYEPTRRNVRRASPQGSVATAEFLEDRFISRNAGGSREIRYDDVLFVVIRGDVVMMRMRSGPTGVMPRVLFPDDVLERLGGPGGPDGRG
ncbi:MAG TPA: hypothetical protein VGK78_15110 [Nocardioides sp.]|uniref:hypothetical protein n=1 Tax=Nocardioides sp. TaxID=35761 RepID=UPI002F3EE5B1